MFMSIIESIKKITFITFGLTGFEALETLVDGIVVLVPCQVIFVLLIVGRIA